MPQRTLALPAYASLALNSTFALCVLFGLTTPTEAAPPPKPDAKGLTVYTIRNRWKQFIYCSAAKISYDKGSDDTKHRWVLEEAAGGLRIKNLATGAYLAAAKDAREVKLVRPVGGAALDKTSLWTIDTVSGPWQSVKNNGTGKYMTCERQGGHVDCDGTNVPTDKTWWLSQWEFIHVAGPKPPKRYRLHQIAVTSPEYCSDVKGSTTVTLVAKGFKSVTVKCWKHGGRFGADSTVATVGLDAKGAGAFVFPADAYPHGPVTVRISGKNGAAKDNCYLQLYNKGGVSWNEGIPKNPPPAAKGMTLVFADDFNGPLSISSTDAKAKYYDHKPPDGWQDFSTIRFTSFDKPNNPFRQIDSYLRIRASESAKSSGLISSVKNDASGITAKAPCYFECRFIAPNAIGTWPAFWLMTDYMTDHVKGIKNAPCDELDIIEAYGGEGPGKPNAFDKYMIHPHCWNQGPAGKAIEKKAFAALGNPIRMRKFDIPSTWFETFHTYGCKIADTDTIYYCDDIEVARHPTLPLSKRKSFFFMIDLATGGGWPVDLSRYDGTADMYVDYVRVYQGRK